MVPRACPLSISVDRTSQEDRCGLLKDRKMAGSSQASISPISTNWLKIFEKNPCEISKEGRLVFYLKKIVNETCEIKGN